MMPTLKPEAMSPSSQSFTGYRGSQRRMGKKRKSRDLAVEAEHLPGEGAGAEKPAWGAPAPPGSIQLHPAQPYLAFRRQPRTEVLLGGFLCASSSSSASLSTSLRGTPGRWLSTISAAMAPGPPRCGQTRTGSAAPGEPGPRSREGSKVAGSGANGDGAAARRRRWMAPGWWHPICHPGAQRGVPIHLQAPPVPPTLLLHPARSPYVLRHGRGSAAAEQSPGQPPPASAADFAPLHMRGAGISTLGKPHGLSSAPAPLCCRAGGELGASARRDSGVPVQTRSSGLVLRRLHPKDAHRTRRAGGCACPAPRIAPSPPTCCAHADQVPPAGRTLCSLLLIPARDL